MYDPGCGTGGFLAQAYEHMAGPSNEKIASPDQLETLKHRTFFGREKDNAIYPIALANLILHNIDEPHIRHGNTLTGAETYGGLFTDAPALFDVILMNPPFGGREGKEAQTRFAYKTGATADSDRLRELAARPARHGSHHLRPVEHQGPGTPDRR